MAIEFKCPQCGNLLRTADETAGKQARCPECGTVQPIPLASSGLPPLPGAGGPSGAFPPPPPPEFNPYSSPAASQHAPTTPYIAAPIDPLNAVQGPAIAMLVWGVIRIVGCVGGLVMAAFGFTRGQPDDMVTAIVISVMSVVGLGIAALIIIGALKMKRLESRALSLTAAILSMLPICLSCCFTDMAIGLGFGIWALVVLSNPTVVAAFRR